VTTDQHVRALLDTCRNRPEASGPGPRSRFELDWLSDASDEQVEQLLGGLPDNLPTAEAIDGVLSPAMHRLCLRRRTSAAGSMPPRMVSALVALYAQLPAKCRTRGYLLRMLSVSPLPAELAQLADLIVTDPPQNPEAVALALGPLFQSDSYDPRPLFPRLLEALPHPSLAIHILDVANHVTRKGLVSVHPAACRKEALIGLLGNLAQRLAQFEEQVEVQDAKPTATAGQVEDSVGLAVSLCDALALIGDPAAIGKLYQAMDLRHRRLRTEASAALARLGEPAGRETLLALASEPVCRLRVLNYAREMGVLEQVDEQYCTPQAQAEAELAVWLAQPAQFGIPPTRLELIQTDTLFWPGFEHPVDCFLFRFVYQFAGGQYSNIGIAGPLTRAILADLADLPVTDIYALFAGWQVQHDEIFEWEIAEVPPDRRAEIAHLERRLQDAGYDAIEPEVLGSFFGDHFLVARAISNGQPGVAAADAQQIEWHGAVGVSHPLGPREACCLYKGRRVLQNFNP
jgi:hypothetical protein